MLIFLVNEFLEAKKEVRRLNGEPLLDLDLNNASFVPRPRRPSLLGFEHLSFSRRFLCQPVYECYMGCMKL